MHVLLLPFHVWAASPFARLNFNLDFAVNGKVEMERGRRPKKTKTRGRTWANICKKKESTENLPEAKVNASHLKTRGIRNIALTLQPMQSIYACTYALLKMR